MKNIIKQAENAKSRPVDWLTVYAMAKDKIPTSVIASSFNVSLARIYQMKQLGKRLHMALVAMGC